MSTPISPRPVKRSSWLRKLLFAFGGLVVLLVVAYFVITSSAFFKGVVLPRVSHAVGGEVTVADASISPFSSVTLRQLTVKTTGTEPLLQAEEVRLRYGLFSILAGTLKLGEVTIVSPVVQIFEDADGTSNLDPLLQKEAKPAAKPAPAPSKPPRVDLKNFTLKNATVRRVKLLKDGGREVTELGGLNITLDQLKNGQSGKLTTAASFKMNRPTSLPRTPRRRSTRSTCSRKSRRSKPNETIGPGTPGELPTRPGHRCIHPSQRALGTPAVGLHPMVERHTAA